MKLRDIVVFGPAGIKVVPGSSGIPRIANMSSRKRQEFIMSFKEIEGEADIILIDTAAGMSKNVTTLALVADEVVLVTTPEPSAITDAYAMIKVLHSEKPEAKIRLIVNMVNSDAQAFEVAQKVAQVSRQFLNFQVCVLGGLPTDPCVQRAVMRRQPWSELFPRSAATKAIGVIASKLLNGEDRAPSNGDGFIQRLSSYLMR
jgi:flagellar biosynthesis protein FlhG